jgi:hypothetical protein
MDLLILLFDWGLDSLSFRKRTLNSFDFFSDVHLVDLLIDILGWLIILAKADNFLQRTYTTFRSLLS